MKNKILVIHHSDADGFGAAYAAWVCFWNTADYISVNYNDSPPDVTPYDIVFVLDFSFPLEVMRSMQHAVPCFVVIDHHKTAKDAVLAVGGYYDEHKSGCELSWEYFHRSPVPELLSYVGDRDLWKFALPASEEVNAYIATLPYDFMAWDAAANKPVTSLVETGTAVYALQKKQVEGRMKDVHMKELRIGNESYIVPCVNATENISLLGNEMCKAYPDAPFSMSYCDRKEVRTYSLRSIGNFDVSIVAKALGGGGHKNAAGYSEEKP